VRAIAAAAAAQAAKAVVAAPAARAAAAPLTLAVKPNRNGNRMLDYPQIVVSVCVVNIVMLKICPKPLYAATAADVEVNFFFLSFI